MEYIWLLANELWLSVKLIRLKGIVDQFKTKNPRREK